MKAAAGETAMMKFQGEISDTSNYFFFIVWKQLSPG